MFEVGKVLNRQYWKLYFFIQRRLMETQVQHQLLQTGSSPRFRVYLERLWLSEHETIPPLLIPSLCQNREQYHVLQGVPLTSGWITCRITSMIPRPMIVTAMGENLRGAATFAPNLSMGRSIHCPLMLCLSKILLLDIPVSPDAFLTDITHFSIPLYNVSDTVCLSYSSRNRPMRRKPNS